MKKITMTLDPSSIQNAINELNAYKKWLADKTNELTKRLAEIGADIAEDRFASAMYDGVNDVVVTVEQIDGGWKILASGEAVCFIEFGSGVFWNPSEPHPKRPPEVVGIGEYGLGQGKKKGWAYKDASGQRQFTRGNPASVAMWGARQKIVDEVRKVAKEVFSS